MPRWQSVLAILAIFFVAGAVWPWSPLNRVLCAAIAFGLILTVLVSRLQQHASAITSGRSSVKDMQSRIDEIRTQRENRFRRR
jgi:hypothetical protein